MPSTSEASENMGPINQYRENINLGNISLAVWMYCVDIVLPCIGWMKNWSTQFFQIPFSEHVACKEKLGYLCLKLSLDCFKHYTMEQMCNQSLFDVMLKSIMKLMLLRVWSLKMCPTLRLISGFG